MGIKIAGGPCCWGVDDPKNPHLPSWQRVLSEAAQAGYKGVELGPYGYIPMDTGAVREELEKNGLNIIAGTIFDNLVSSFNYDSLKKQVHDICSLLTKLPQPHTEKGQSFPTPYLVLIDWGHDERDYAAGHPGKAPRLSTSEWKNMVGHIVELSKIAKNEYGVRSVIHPHAGGHIEFSDEIDMIVADVSYEHAGLCLDTGHLYYSKMDPVAWLEKYADALDYIHFKDIDLSVYNQVMGERVRFFEACGKGVMCPIGEGVIDYAQVRDLLTQIEYNGYITIEQERDPRDSDTSLHDVRKSLEYLEKMCY